MRKIFFFLTALLLFSSCEKDNTGKLDPNAMILIRPAAGVKLRSSEHLTALEIVQQTYNMEWWNESLNADDPITRGFAEVQRDYETPLLKMWGTDIVSQNGTLYPDFIEGHDVVLLREILIRDGEILEIVNPFTLIFNEKVRGDDIVKDDTIAYIPNRVISSARASIRAAYESEDYAECYRLFNEAFTFIPVTGEEYKALKSQNLN